MKITMLGMFAAVLLTGMPAYAAKEFDCPPGQEVQSQRNEAVMSEDLLEKRRQAREADLARMRERLTRSPSPAQPAAGSEQAAVR